MPVEIRDYKPGDEPSWLRCRVLSFLGTAYFDDVMTVKRYPLAGADLVAVESGTVVGVLELPVDGPVATIDTIGVHPDHQNRGIATRSLNLATAQAAALGADSIEAWTRDDEPALAWYRARGFAESSHYLHVYADHYVSADEPGRAVLSRPGLEPIKVFVHAAIDKEAEMRRQLPSACVPPIHAAGLFVALGEATQHVLKAILGRAKHAGRWLLPQLCVAAPGGSARDAGARPGDGARWRQPELVSISSGCRIPRCVKPGMLDMRIHG